MSADKLLRYGSLGALLVSVALLALIVGYIVSESRIRPRRDFPSPTSSSSSRGTRAGIRRSSASVMRGWRPS